VMIYSVCERMGFLLVNLVCDPSSLQEEPCVHLYQTPKFGTTDLLFQERFSILESEWESLFRAKLFPFAGLRNETIDAIRCDNAGGHGRYRPAEQRPGKRRPIHDRRETPLPLLHET